MHARPVQDINMMVMLMPIGFVLCFRPLSDASLFLVLYGATAVYFSGVMVRLMLVLAPAACCLAAIAASELLKRFSAGIVAGARSRLSPAAISDSAVTSPKCACPPLRVPLSCPSRRLCRHLCAPCCCALAACVLLLCRSLGSFRA